MSEYNYVILNAKREYALGGFAAVSSYYRNLSYDEKIYANTYRQGKPTNSALDNADRFAESILYAEHYEE